jgi:hypothetical protein
MIKQICTYSSSQKSDVARQFSRVNSAPDNSARSIQPQTIQLKDNSAPVNSAPDKITNL